MEFKVLKMFKITLRFAFKLLFVVFVIYSLGKTLYFKFDTHLSVRKNIPKTGVTAGVRPNGYLEALSKYSDDKKWIYLLGLAGNTYVDFGINFYLTSLKKLNIQNYLFMVFSDDVMRTCSKYGMNCYVYKRRNFSEKKKLNTFRGKAYKQKTDIRMYYTLEALKLGFNVYMADVDEHF